MKIKFNADNGLHLKKTVELNSMTIFVRAIFHEGNKYYTQVFLAESGFDNYHKIVLRDRVSVPKFWHT